MDTKTGKENKDNYMISVLNEDVLQFDLSFKLIVIGDSGVGKSCLTMKATKNIFDEDCQPTVGFEFFSFNMKINDKVIKLQIWDTCGQEIYRSLITNFYRNSSLALVVYAINDSKSFENINSWIKELKSHSSPDIKIILVGNKSDLENDRLLSKEAGMNLYQQLSLDAFYESSAKNGNNSQAIFIEAAKILYENYLIYGSKSQSRSSSFDANLENQNKIKLPEITSTSKIEKTNEGSGKCCK